MHFYLCGFAMKNTIIISAFPGIGKTYAFNMLNTLPDFVCFDCDSSNFDKKNFPKNYVKHIRNNIGKADIIFISTHKEVRDLLVKQNMKFTLVYPNIQDKEIFLERYKERNNYKRSGE